MPRILKADLLVENDRLRMQLAEYQSKRDRSRSPRREAESASKTRLALDLVSQFERDPVIHEQRATIARLQQEIQALRSGSGPISEVLLSNYQRHYPTLIDDFVREHMAKSTDSVADYMHKLQKSFFNIDHRIRWGRDQ